MDESKTKPLANRSSKRSTSVQGNMRWEEVWEERPGQTLAVEMVTGEGGNVLSSFSDLPSSEVYSLDRDEEGSSKRVDIKNK